MTHMNPVKFFQNTYQAILTSPDFQAFSKRYKDSKKLDEKIKHSPLLQRALWEAEFGTRFTDKITAVTFNDPTNPNERALTDVTQPKCSFGTQSDIDGFLLFKAYQKMDNEGWNLSSVDSIARYETIKDVCDHFSPFLNGAEAYEARLIVHAMSMQGHYNRVLTQLSSESKLGLIAITVMYNLSLAFSNSYALNLAAHEVSFSQYLTLIMVGLMYAVSRPLPRSLDRAIDDFHLIRCLCYIGALMAALYSPNASVFNLMAHMLGWELITLSSFLGLDFGIELMVNQTELKTRKVQKQN